MGSLEALSFGVLIGLFCSTALVYFGYNFGRATFKQIDFPPLIGNGTFRKAFSVGVGGKKKPRINDDEKAYRLEQDSKKSGGING